MNSNSSSLDAKEAIEKMLVYQATACNDTATLLLAHYEPIVRMAAARLSRSRPDLYEDLFQVGQLSMLRLFQQYDTSRDIPFEAYAMKSVVGHLKNYLRDKSWYIQVPRRIKEKGLLIQQAIDQLTVERGHSPSIEEIAVHLELSVEETIEVLSSREAYNYVSLDTPLSNEGDSNATIGDFIVTEQNEYETVDIRLDLEEALGQLKDEEKEVLLLAYNNGLPQRDIAARLGVSQMSVSRIQKRAIGKLKELLEEQEEGQEGK
ncbi:sigma-70 family RNA polymerase sigma factor [Paenibacillus sp. YIM B09110]|uniref:sigma-70 family RNA polymerase sigma factor n=1 Tax=Paenibacillus sp. YIM B09110 TaxID=3126102 RepID=UPI00301C9A2F